MPAQLAHPGVYIEEVPSGVRTITGVATSITAFVGRAARGRTDEPVTINSFGDFEREFGGLWKESTLGFAVRDFYLNGGSAALIVRVYREEDGVNPKPDKAVFTVGGSLQLRAENPGAWGNNLRARVDHDTRPFDASLGETGTSLFNLYIHDRSTGVTEEHRNVVVAPADHPRLVTNVLLNESRLVRVAAPGGARPTASSNAVDDGKTVWDDNTTATNAKPSGGGLSSDGLPLEDDQFNGTGLETAKEGLFALDKADLFNLLVIPPYKNDGTVDAGVVTSANLLCERHRALQIVDGLPTWNEVSDVVTDFATGFSGVLGTNSKNAALFFPRLKQPNPLKDNQVEVFAAAGAVAGVMARTDAQRGVWKAPAGLDATLDGVPELSVRLTDPEIGQLNPLGVNCLRAMPAAGRVVWGARTMQGADRLAREWKYIPVRRTALFLEESLFRGTQWVVFEPNDEPLWAQIRLNVGAFMNNLFRQGAFQGTTPARRTSSSATRRRRPRHDIDARDRQHPGRLRSAEAGRVRRDPPPADGRPERRLGGWLGDGRTFKEV